jgi:hypothetical protein
VSLVEFEVAGVAETLFLCDTLDAARAGVPKGVTRGRVWTLDETNLVRGIEPGERIAVAEAKLIFDAAVTHIGEPTPPSTPCTQKTPTAKQRQGGTTTGKGKGFVPGPWDGGASAVACRHDVAAKRAA